MIDPSLAQNPAPIPEEGPPFSYPHPLQLARARAERIETHAAWGALGGLTTLYRHGTDHYRRLSAMRRTR